MFPSSVLDLEVEYALLLADRPDDQLIWYQRSIEDIHDNLDQAAVKEYVDLLPLDPQIDPNVAKRLEAIRAKLGERVSTSTAENIMLPNFQNFWNQNTPKDQKSKKNKFSKRSDEYRPENIINRTDMLSNISQRRI